MDFLHYRRLPMDDFYDIVIFGYLSAVQQYFRDPPSNVTFKAMAFRAMKDSLLREGEYHACAKRRGVTVDMDNIDSMLTNPKLNTERQVTDKVLLEQAVNTATPKEAKIIALLLDGFVLREAARLLKMPKAAAVNCMEKFYCRAKAAIG